MLLLSCSTLVSMNLVIVQRITFHSLLYDQEESDLWIFSGVLMEASKASILVMWTGDFMHSIVRRMRCEVNSAAALLASVDLPLRLWAPLLIDFGSFGG